MTEARVSDRQAVPPENLPMTVEEFFSRYADQPAEVVNGEVVLMSPNTRPSMRVALPLVVSLFSFASEHDLGEVTIETAFVLDADERTDWVRDARQPDIAFVSKDRIAPHDQKHGEGGPWRLAPDLAVEVVSPTDSYDDVQAKVLDYLRFGTRLVWVLSPRLRTIHVHTPDHPDGSVLREGDTLSADPVLPGWSMPVSEVFARP